MDFTFPCDIKEQYKIWKNVPRFLLLDLEKIFLCMFSVPWKKIYIYIYIYIWSIWANASLLVLYKSHARSRKNFSSYFQFIIFKPLSYCFEETIGFDLKASFASCPLSRLISWYSKPGDITKEYWKKAIQFHGTFQGLKIKNCFIFTTHSLRKPVNIQCP